MWEQRCKVAVSGVGFSKVTRSAEIPLAAHALQQLGHVLLDGFFIFDGSRGPIGQA